jgi:hypothetical protein
VSSNTSAQEQHGSKSGVTGVTERHHDGGIQVKEKKRRERRKKRTRQEKQKPKKQRFMPTAAVASRGRTN